MGGELLVRSAPGEGSTLTCRLLLSEAAHDPAVTDRPRLGARLQRSAPDHPARGRRSVPPGPASATCSRPSDSRCVPGAQWPLLPGAGGAASAGPGAAGYLAARHDGLGGRPGAAPHGGGGSRTGTLVGGSPRRTCSRSSSSRPTRMNISPGGDGASPHDAFIMKPVELETLLTPDRRLLQLQWVHDPRRRRSPRRARTAAGNVRRLPATSGCAVPARPHRPRARHRGEAARNRTAGRGHFRPGEPACGR